MPKKSESEARARSSIPEARSVDPLDHRKLGQRLGIFALDSCVGKGLPLWLPRGTVIREELERLAKELEFKAGFQRVATPHLARIELYRRSGHLPYFAPDMYPPIEVPEDAGHGDEALKDAYVLRPMNCPHHHRVFAAQPRSYRELPLRLAEYGQVYRWERSGALAGLARVRGMCMNDGHIYCTADQVERELHAVLDMYAEVYALLGIEGHRFRLSRRDPDDGKYAVDVAAWQWSETLLHRVLEERGLEYEDGVGHAAFYGPKIDVQVRTSLGTEETLSTVQLDFVQPARLGLGYTASSGATETPYCIHRAPLSTHERFVAFLLELYRGAFPVWLAPVQLWIVPVSDAYRSYAERIVRRLRARLVRAEVAPAGETVARNVREAARLKMPVVAVVGGREERSACVTLRLFGDERRVEMSVEELERRLLYVIPERRRAFDLELESDAS